MNPLARFDEVHLCGSIQVGGYIGVTGTRYRCFVTFCCDYKIKMLQNDGYCIFKDFYVDFF